MGVQEVAAALAKKPTSPFVWGGNGEALTPEQVATRQRMADSLRQPAGHIPRGTWSLIGDLAGEGVANYKENEADQATKAGHDKVAAALAEARKTGDYTGVMADEWATPGQTAVAGALQGRNWQKEDQAANWAREDARAARAEAIAAQNANQPKWQTIESGGDTYRWNANDPNAKPELFFDGPDAPTGPNVKGESDLRTEYNGINTVKDFGLQTQAYQRVLNSAKDPSPAGDLALIFNYMKVLDPGSTVREGEFATAQNSGSIPEQIWAQYNKAMTGERLVPEIRQDFVKRAGDLFKGAAELQGNTNQRYSDLATDYGYDPSRIVAKVPQIGVLDPSFKIEDYLASDGTQNKPLPVTNEADYQAIPKGAQYVDPEGNVRTKQ